jgi:hypothetical protein
MKFDILIEPQSKNKEKFPYIPVEIYINICMYVCVCIYIYIL